MYLYLFNSLGTFRKKLHIKKTGLKKYFSSVQNFMGFYSSGLVASSNKFIIKHWPEVLELPGSSFI